ncbi:phosphohydrolase [Thermoplasmatales archaeon ex4484_30]|nr:MAG: phosphohydrolase [Thermoplasmatales archaeon ex4484_30]
MINKLPSMKNLRNFTAKDLKNVGIEVEVPEGYAELEKEAVDAILEVLAKYPKAMKMFEMMVEDDELRADWDLANFIAVKKLHYNDHGEVHAKIVAANALKMYQLLLEGGIKPDFIEYGGGDYDDDALILLSASLLHDIGNQIYRGNHPLHSSYLAISILERLLPKIYDDVEKKTEVRGFILNAIYAHDADVPDITMESALVGIADATDMTKGRGRMAFDLGSTSIHVVSALSIDTVLIAKGKEKPIEIIIEMSNSSGIFQVEETLGKKVVGSPMEACVDITAMVTPAEVNYDKRIVRKIKLKGRKFTTA